MAYPEKSMLRYAHGYHLYRLEAPFCLVEAGESLCDITGFSLDELVSAERDMYAEHIHPSDKKKYVDFLAKLSQKEQSRSQEYRFICKNGTVKYIMDTAVSFVNEDGLVYCVSVLSDITGIKNENYELRYLNDTAPCGFLKYTCEKTPKITYINEKMLEILRFPEPKEGEIDYRELYGDNIYLMIPIEERRKFAHFLEQVSVCDSAVSGEIPVIRCDGTKGVLYGWVSKVKNGHGNEEFQSICFDITEKYRSKMWGEITRCTRALSYVYDKIFEFDFENMTVKYIHGDSSDFFGAVRNVPMQIEQATLQWIQNTVADEDAAEVEKFFRPFFSGSMPEQGRTRDIRFRSVSSSKEVYENTGVFIPIGNSVCLFCCKTEKAENDATLLRDENLSLKSMNENMHKLVMSFTDGIVAFEIKGDTVRPLYVSDNVCGFFGYTREQWLPMAQSGVRISDFVANSGIQYGDVERLLERKEAEFEYTDSVTGIKKKINAVCSCSGNGTDAPVYIILHDPGSDRHAEVLDVRKVVIRTFGYFDVFVDGHPIAFRNKKSKELLALLVDRRGGFVSSEEAIGFLWEDEPVNAVTLSRYRKVALRLKNILEEYGITDIVESVDGKRRIVTDRVSCDLYDYMTGAAEFSSLFKGSYLSNYSWAETTLGELAGR